MSYEPGSPIKSSKKTSCAFFTFTGTPTADNPLTPVLVGSSSNFSPTISSNNIQLPEGEYILRFFGAITRTSGDRNIVYKWKVVGGSLTGVAGATNRELGPGSAYVSIESADAHLILSNSGEVQIIMTNVDAGVTLDTSNTHAVIWRVG